MTTALIALALLGPFALAAMLAWSAHRSGHLHISLDQFRPAAPFTGRLAGSDDASDRDGLRVSHDLDATRTRFEEPTTFPARRSPGPAHAPRASATRKDSTAAR